jgi:hypothetical protein
MADSKSVCGDLLGRLESKIPGGAPILKAAGSDDFLKKIANDNSEIIKRLEEENRRLKAPVKETTAAPDFMMEIIETPEPVPEPVKVPPPPPPKPIEEKPVVREETGCKTPTDSGVLAKLSTIVSRFNEDLAAWHKDSGCVVNFAWKYGDYKAIEITGIDYIVYRKPAPSGESIKEVLARHKP